MAPEESALITVRTSDGCDHFVREWRAQGAARAVLIYLHGIEGHSLWFNDTAKFLAQQGFTTRAVDRRGSGMSKEQRGDSPNHVRLIKDVEEIILDTVKKEEKLPIFLMANCWGAKLAALVCKKQSPVSRYISGLILSSPAVAVKVDLPLMKKIEIGVRRLFGNLQPVPLPLVPENFTDNPRYLSHIRADELRLTEATSRFLVDGFILTLLSAKASPSIEMPLLIVQSGIDDIVNIDGVNVWFAKCAAPDKTMKLFRGVFHSLDFHTEPSEYRSVLCDWLKKRCDRIARSR